MVCEKPRVLGSLLAGSIVAVVSYSLLSLLGVAMAMTLYGEDFSWTAQQLGTAAGIWTFVSLILSMFLGGWVSTRFTTGEFRYEAILYGIVVWGVSSMILIPLASFGVGGSVGSVLASRGIAKFQSEMEPLIANAQQQFADKSERAENLLASFSRRLSKANDEESSSNQSSSSDSESSNKSSSRQEETSTTDKAVADNSSSDNTSTASSESNGSRSDSNESRQVARRDNSSNENSNSKEVKTKLMAASWYAFGGTLFSVLAAVFGAVVGPTLNVTHHKVPVRTVCRSSLGPSLRFRSNVGDFHPFYAAIVPFYAAHRRVISDLIFVYAPAANCGGGARASDLIDVLVMPLLSRFIDGQIPEKLRTSGCHVHRRAP